MQDLLYRGPLPPYLPFVDPDVFREKTFYQELERIGYRQILMGGTGTARMADCIRMVQRETHLKLALHPSSPGEIVPVDLVLLPAVMNSNSHYTRPFGSGAVTCAMAVADQAIRYLPIAYFVLGESTARWYSDAFLVSSKKLIVGYCTYARMLSYDWVFLDYEDPRLNIDWHLIGRVKATGARLLVSDEFTPQSAREGRKLGIDTIVTPSNLYEQARDPVKLAREFHAALLADA
jgi:heptaprenylglyceryl phosphate synthase